MQEKPHFQLNMSSTAHCLTIKHFVEKHSTAIQKSNAYKTSLLDKTIVDHSSSDKRRSSTISLADLAHSVPFLFSHVALVFAFRTYTIITRHELLLLLLPKLERCDNRVMPKLTRLVRPTDITSIAFNAGRNVVLAFDRESERA